MTVLSKGGRPRKTGNNGGPVYTTTLKELGLTKRESSEAQLLFLLSKEKPDLWEELLAGKVSRTAAFKTMREQRTKTGDALGIYRTVRRAVNEYLQRHPGTPWSDVDATLVSILEAIREEKGTTANETAIFK